MKKFIQFITLASVICSCTSNMPSKFDETSAKAKIYPEYDSIVIPCNIAPMNFKIEEGADEYAVCAACGEQKLTASAGKEGKIEFESGKWKKIVSESVGKDITLNIFAKKDGKWIKFADNLMRVCADSIDKYLTYRLIEPSYMSSAQLGLYQFDLETGCEDEIVSTHYDYKQPHNRNFKCVNCHTSQRNKPENKMFYYRCPNGGLLISYNGKFMKVNTKAGDMFAGTVYPSWHPFLPYIAFSSNNVKQGFHSFDKSKIETFDQYSDLVLYNIEKNEITPIRKTYDKQETNPCWSGDGQYLYFNSSDSLFTKHYEPNMMKYDIFRIKFNSDSLTWGENEMVFNATKDNKSATYPKVSPDNKYLLFTRADWGTSTQTNKSADLWLIDLEKNTSRNIVEVNCPTEADSYHDWSSNSKWIVFCSRREDGNYARAYFSHIDQNGRFSKPFIIPCSDPDHNRELLRNYNVTEFTTAPSTWSKKDIRDVLNGELINANYGGEIDPHMADAYSGATTVIK